MTLLKISESNINAKFRRKRFAVGIDLGTTNSLVAIVDSNNQVQILSDSEGRYLLPSVVQYKKNSCIVGHMARENAGKDPANTIFSVKRMIGRSLEDIQKQYPFLPYQFYSNKYKYDNRLMISTNHGLRSPVQISADILKSLATRATENLQCNLDGTVITVPAYFDDVQRQSTKEAANIAGLHVLRLLNEPTAAAIAYGLDTNKEGIIAVYDLGGGTFDISILRINHGIFEVLATGGDSALGGDDFDNLLADFIRKQAGIVDYRNRYIHRELLETAITTKIALSSMQHVNIKIGNWQGNISCNQLNDLIKPLIKRTLLSCHRALKDARIGTGDILEVVMVGGSTRIPLVREYVGKFFGRVPLTNIDPDKVVAIGAAIQADILVGNKPNNEMLLLDVIPLSLGLEVIGGVVEQIIPRNSSIPVIHKKEFTTFKDNQTIVSIHIVQGEGRRVQDCRSLTRFTLHGIPALPKGKVRILVTFQVDTDGLLSVKAVEQSTGIESAVCIKPSDGLTDSKIFNLIHNFSNYLSINIFNRIELFYCC